MSDIKTVDIDLAKNVFPLTAVDEPGTVVERKRLRRTGLQSYLTMLPPGCAVAMCVNRRSLPPIPFEACQPNRSKAATRWSIATRG